MELKDIDHLNGITWRGQLSLHSAAWRTLEVGPDLFGNYSRYCWQDWSQLTDPSGLDWLFEKRNGTWKIFQIVDPVAYAIAGPHVAAEANEIAEMIKFPSCN